jgi:hypothetical protein
MLGPLRWLKLQRSPWFLLNKSEVWATTGPMSMAESGKPARSAMYIF